MITDYRNKVLCGDALSLLRQLPEACVQCCVTSPPYYGLRDYNTQPQIWDGEKTCEHEWGETLRTPWANEVAGPNGRVKNVEASRERPKETGPFCQRCGAWRGSLGLEPTPELYVQHLVTIFREVRRVLRPDGTCWLNIGDSYAGSWGSYAPGGIKGEQRPRTEERWERRAYTDTTFLPPNARAEGFKSKDLMMIPAKVAMALQSDGWYLRSQIIWHKTNCMPESVEDRPTNSHEYIYLLAKSEHYYYDAVAIAEPASRAGEIGVFGGQKGSNHVTPIHDPNYRNGHEQWGRVHHQGPTRNKRSVWTVPTKPFSEAHFATFPVKLVEPMILAGSSPKACEHCGSPWERVIEREGTTSTEVAKQKGYSEKREAGGERVTQTTGWQPSCTCLHNSGTGHSVVLDPFAGAGTTLLVASELQRDYLGLELNSEYVQLIEKRIGTVQPRMWEGIA